MIPGSLLTRKIYYIHNVHLFLRLETVLYAGVTRVRPAWPTQPRSTTYYVAATAKKAISNIFSSALFLLRPPNL